MNNNSEPDDQPQNASKYISYVDGLLNPGQIPRGVKMNALGRMHGYDADRLRSSLLQAGVEEHDAVILASSLAQAGAIERKENELSQRRFNSLCEEFNRRPNEFSSRQLADRLQFLDRLEKSAIESHFDSAINGVKPSSRQTLFQILNSHIAPAISYGEMDFIAIAEDFPDSLLLILKQRCSNGDQ